jgi:hypothetical protein
MHPRGRSGKPAATAVGSRAFAPAGSRDGSRNLPVSLLWFRLMKIIIAQKQLVTP